MRSNSSQPICNVFGMAVAVIIGTAFATIVASHTDYTIVPIVGAIFGDLGFTNYFTVSGVMPGGFEGNPGSYTDLKTAGVAVLAWGHLITVLINFLILACIIVMLLRSAPKVMRRVEEVGGLPDVDLRAIIRDQLRRRS